VQQQEAGTGPRGVGIGRTGPQGVDIDPGVRNILDKHKAGLVGSIGLGVDSTRVALVVRHILRGVGKGKAVGQERQLGAGRALDPPLAS